MECTMTKMALVVGLSLSFAASATAQTVTVDGTCPGPFTITASGFEPGEQVSLITADGSGSAEIPSGACAGEITGLSASGLTRRGHGEADETGTFERNPWIPDGFCDAWFQVISTESCASTEARPVTLPEADAHVLFVTDATVGSDEASWLDSRLTADLHCADYAAANAIGGENFRVVYSTPSENASDFVSYTPGDAVFDRYGALLDEVDMWGAGFVLPDMVSWTITGTNTEGGYATCAGDYEEGSWPICQYCEQKFACGSSEDSPFAPSACCWTGTRAVACMGDL
jgi:hypothetical protein